MRLCFLQIREELRANGIDVYPQKEFDEDADDRLINDKIRVSSQQQMLTLWLKYDVIFIFLSPSLFLFRQNHKSVDCNLLLLVSAQRKPPKPEQKRSVLVNYWLKSHVHVFSTGNDPIRCCGQWPGVPGEWQKDLGKKNKVGHHRG